MTETKPPYASLAYGLFFLLLGIASELLSRPVQPIGYVPGLAFVPFGLGVAIGVLERKEKALAMVALYIVMLGVLIYEWRAATSILPFALLIAANGLTRFALAFYQE